MLLCAECNTRKAVHLHNANATGRGMEPDPVQSGRVHTESIWCARLPEIDCGFPGWFRQACEGVQCQLELNCDPRGRCEHESLCCAGTNYIETLRMQIHSNCRIRRVYFSDRLYTEDELPTEFKCAFCVILGSASLEFASMCKYAVPDADEEGGLLLLPQRYPQSLHLTCPLPVSPAERAVP